MRRVRGDRRAKVRVGWSRVTGGTLVAALVLTGCGDDPSDLEVAQAAVADAQAAVTEAQGGFDEATTEFCADSEDYITAIDRYGGVFSDDAATVGDVKAAGSDLEDPREAVASSAEAVVAAGDELALAQQELVDAEAALAAAQATESGTSVTPSTSTTSTTAPFVPAQTVDRVERAEADLAAASQGITDQTPLTQATAQFNAAALALEVAWLGLLVDAGCLTDDQLVEAQAAGRDYTVALQMSLQTAGYYDGEIDGVYGPATVDAVEALQSANGLPVTGLVDRATAAALSTAVAAEGGAAAAQALAHTAAVQSTLKLAGYWTGAVDGQWTPELTDALMAFQTALGVPPTGAVDAATLHALQEAIAEAQSSATSTTVPTDTTTVPATTTASP